jgi:hypothetical protein
LDLFKIVSNSALEDHLESSEVTQLEGVLTIRKRKTDTLQMMNTLMCLALHNRQGWQARDTNGRYSFLGLASWRILNFFHFHIKLEGSF